jgi:gliding motility associated protien GldN
MSRSYSIRFICLISFLLFSFFTFSQSQNLESLIKQQRNQAITSQNPWQNNIGGSPNNSIFEKNHTRSKIGVLHPPVIRESDVTWSKRVWRYIDLNQKLNIPLKTPLEPARGRVSLFSALVTSIIQPIPKHDLLAAFNWGSSTNQDFDFKEQFRTVDNFIDKISNTWETPTGKIDTVYILPKDIVRYAIMEEWFFDKKRSQLDVRILALAPITYEFDKDKSSPTYGTFKTSGGLSVPFYVYFPQARWFLNRFEIFNKNNNSENRTFYQIFLMRRFSSFVYKEDNVYDRRISDYALGIDALLESERIENQIQEFEFDLWEE